MAQHKGGSKQTLKRDFVSSRKYFSYMHRKSKRAYQKKVQDELAEACREDQVEFWRRVKGTGI